MFLRVNLSPARAPGARVRVERAGVPPMVAEYAAGGGWLSQSVPALFFGLGKGPRDGVVTVTWPGGTAWSQSFTENNLIIKAAR
jgi:ASPIC and UnbV